MSQLSRGILGALAISLTLGAGASGRDLGSPAQGPSAAPDTAINRAAKTDRAPRGAMAARTQTISLRLDGLSDTSILVRIPLARDIGNGAPAPLLTKSGKIAVACEPVVSVLTEVATRLQPGRCIT
jgi:hypothetical protein